MKFRSRKGVSLTELAVSTILIAVVLAGIGELVVQNTFASTKLTNKIDGQIGCSRAIRRVCEDVRQARAVGNIYASNGHNAYCDLSQSDDEITVLPPTGGFPGSPWPVTPYKLSPQTLIVQQPVLFQDSSGSANPINGFPLKIKKGAISNSPEVPKVALEYVDSLIYQVVPDDKAPGQFLLQVVRYSEKVPIAGCKLRPAITQPQTVLKGIIGPMDLANPGIPAIFQYLLSEKDSAPISNPTSKQAAAIVGVSINFEVKVPNVQNGANPSIAANHAEAFLKNSRLLRLTND